MALTKTYSSPEEAENSIILAIGNETNPDKLREKLGLTYDIFTTSLFDDIEFTQALDELWVILTSDVDGDGNLTGNDLRITLNKSKKELEDLFLDLNSLLTTNVGSLTSVKLLQSIATVATRFWLLEPNTKYGADLFLKVMIYMVFVRLAKINSMLLEEETIRTLIVRLISHLHYTLLKTKMVEDILKEANERFNKITGSCCGKPKDMPRERILSLYTSEVKSSIVTAKMLMNEKRARGLAEKRSIDLKKHIDEMESRQLPPEEIVIGIKKD